MHYEILQKLVLVLYILNYEYYELLLYVFQYNDNNLLLYGII